MKKLVMIFLGLFLVLGIVSCGGSKIEVPDYSDYEEQADMPVNLTVNDSTKILSWDAVDGASGYGVYVDGELETEVDDASYDFSGLTGDHIVFSVQALGPRGVADSQMSATVAYVANKAAEMSAMASALSDSGMGSFDLGAFAEELVNKGFLADDFETIYDNAILFGDIDSTDGFTEVYALVDDLFTSMELYQIEAFVSATVKVELYITIESQLDNSWYLSDEDIAMYESLSAMIEDDADAVVQSVMVVFEYILNVQSEFDEELVGQIDSVYSSLGTTSFNAATFVAVKDDIVTKFKEELPSVNDVMLMNTTIMTFVSAMLGNETTLDATLIGKQAASELMSAELFFNFLLTMDEDYFDALNDFGTTPSYVNYQKTFAKENVDLLNTFLDEQEDLIDAINDVFTDEEKADMYFEYMVVMQSQALFAGGISFETNTGTINIEDYINYQDIITLQDAGRDMLNLLIDEIVASDYAIIDSAIDYIDLSENGTYDSTNIALGNLMNDCMVLLNTLVQDVDQDTYDALIGYMLGEMDYSFALASELETGGMIFTAFPINAVSLILENTSDNQLAIIQNLFSLLVDGSYVNEIAEFSNDSSLEAMYGQYILVADLIVEFYADSEGDITAIIDEIETQLKDEQVLEDLGLTEEDVDGIVISIEARITNLVTYADMINDYDYQNLTSVQEVNVLNFMETFSSILMFGGMY